MKHSTLPYENCITYFELSAFLYKLPTTMLVVKFPFSNSPLKRDTELLSKPKVISDAQLIIL